MSLILSSSGTTGQPKGVMLTGKNILLPSGHFGKIMTAFLGGNEIRGLSLVPWFHAVGCLSIIRACIGGYPLIYLPRFIDHLFLKTIEVSYL